MKNKRKMAFAALVTAAGGVLIYLKKRKESLQTDTSEQAETDKESSANHKQGIYEKYIKRPQDFCCALAAILILSPIMAVTALLVRIKLGTPVIFHQERPGMDGKVFTLYKFRTMTDQKDEQGNLLPDEVRLTEFGKKLRSTSLDELPELPRYKLDENRQIVIDEILEERNIEAPMPEREEISENE